MSLKQELNTLLHKEMDRKTFMKHIAFAAAMLTGVSTFMKLISSMNKESLNMTELTGKANERRTGYGRVGYGTRLERDS